MTTAVREERKVLTALFADVVGSTALGERLGAHAIDREALAAVCPANLVVATGGVVPPALQGTHPTSRCATTPSSRASISPARDSTVSSSSRG